MVSVTLQDETRRGSFGQSVPLILIPVGTTLKSRRFDFHLFSPPKANPLLHLFLPSFDTAQSLFFAGHA